MNNSASDSEEDIIIQGSITEGGLIQYEGAEDFFEAVLGGMARQEDDSLSSLSDESESSSESSSESEINELSEDEKSPLVESDSEELTLDEDNSMIEDKSSIYSTKSDEDYSPFIEIKDSDDESKTGGDTNNEEKDLSDVKNMVKKLLKKL